MCSKLKRKFQAASLYKCAKVISTNKQESIPLRLLVFPLTGFYFISVTYSRSECYLYDLLPVQRTEMKKSGSIYDCQWEKINNGEGGNPIKSFKLVP